MTRFANPAVYQCLACSGYLLRSRLLSFNDYGARYWSDGQSSRFVSPAFGYLICCPECAAVFWQDDVRPVGQLPNRPFPVSRFMHLWARVFGDRDGRLQQMREWAEIPGGWKTARYGLQPQYLDLEPGLRQEGLSREREVRLRRSIWWFSNDHQRLKIDGSAMVDAPIVPQDVARANMVRMVDLLGQDSGTLVERGELLRQLGHFDDALQVLKSVPRDGYSRASKIQTWALARDAGLKVL